MNSAVKRMVKRKRPQLHPTPPLADNYQYVSLLNHPQSTSGEDYYVQNYDGGRQVQNYSFNAPRKSTHSSEGFMGQPQVASYPGTQHASYDENAIPSNSLGKIPYRNGSAAKHSPEFQKYSEEEEYQMNCNNQRVGRSKGIIQTDKAYMSNTQKDNYGENNSVEMEYSQPSKMYHKIHNKRQSNQTIQEEQEEQESKTSKEETKLEDSLQKNPVGNTGDQIEEGLIGDETVHTTNHGRSRIQPSHEYSSLQKLPAKSRHFDSFSNKLVDFSKEESPEPKNNLMTFLCLNLYEILNRNKIPVKQNPEDSSQDMVIKIFESVAHELRLKKDRIENLENEDIDKTKKWDKLKDHNDSLMKAHQKLEWKYAEQEREYELIIKNQKQNFNNLTETGDEEKEQLKREITRLKNKNRQLDND